MSFLAMAWAMRQKLPCTQKIVLMMLSERHNKDTGQCNPSHDLLADDCGLTRRSVMDQIAKLAEAGYLQIRHRAANNVKLPNQYVLMFSFGAQEVVKNCPEVVNDVHQGSERRSLGVVNDVPGVVNVVHQGSEPRSHKPLIEPLIEPKDKKKAQALVTLKADSSIAKPEDVSKAVWDDFVTQRREKHAKLTNTALAGIKREADKAGWGLEKALAESCTRGWTSFKADWVADKQPAAMTAANSETTYQRSMRERVAEFAPDIARKAPGEAKKLPQTPGEFFEVEALRITQ